MRNFVKIRALAQALLTALLMVLPAALAWSILSIQSAGTLYGPRKSVAVGITGEMQRPVLAPPAPQTAQKKPAAALPPSNFRPGEAYAYPNPARRGAKPTIHVETGLADSVELRIFDIAGSLVHRVELSGPPGVIDDGQGDEYAYEYAWNEDVPSGTYFCVVRSRKAGEQDWVRTLKLAVVR